MADSASDDNELGGRNGRPPNSFHVFVELVIVGGASLLAIFWIIPGQTVAAEAFGLSPAMMPLTCATAIAVLALLQCIVRLVRRRKQPVAAGGAGGGRPSMIHSLPILAAAVVGTMVLARFGLLAGGVVLALLVSLAIGERRLWRNVALCGAVAAVMLLVDLSGI